MNVITKVSQITWADAQDYLRLPETTTDEQKTLTNMIGIASSYIQKYTGLTAEQLDESQDFVIVMFVLIQDMWDNRTLYVEKSNLNNVVETILGMHSINLLPEAEASENA